MSAHEFTEELQRRGLLADRLLTKLRDKLSESDRPLSARAVAKFLVQRQHLTQQQATDALNALLVRGVDVDAAPAFNEPGITVVGDVVVDEEADDAESSSIFTPFLADKSASSQMTALPPADPDELQLADIGDDQDAPSNRMVDEPPPERSTRYSTGSAREEEDVGSQWTAINTELTAGPAEITSPTVGGAAPPAVPGSLRRPADDMSRLEKGKKTKKKPAKRKSDFDSPLILVGGGALVLLILCGIAVLLLLWNRSGGDTLQLAEQAANSGAYSQAIELYEDFLARFKGHPDRSAARVKLAMIRLRRDFEGGDLDRTLATAQKELPDVEQEEKFADAAHEDLAALLPRIAQGFADRADAAASLEDARKSIDQAGLTLALASNTRYIPDALRNQAQLDEVKATLARIERRQQTQQDLKKALADMESAVTAGDTNAAYAAHRKLIVERPELVADAALKAMVEKTTAAEQAKIHFVADERPAETSEQPTPWVASLAIAQRRAGGAAGAAGEPICIGVEGAVYGLDSASGRLLWRRRVGLEQRAALSSAPINVGGDMLVIDAAGKGLVRLNATSGELRWRQTIGEPCAAPLVVGDRVYLAAETGRLYVLDLNSGARKGYVQFAQPLGVSPAADRQGQRLYLAGDHASLYCLSLADMSCLGVYYMGHSKGSVRVAPAVAQNKLALLENDGVETCRLRLFTLGAQGAITAQATERRLNGLAASPPLVAGRRLVVVTDRGQLDVFDVGAGEDDTVLSQVATREATDSQPVVRYVTVADGHIWIGDNQLTKHAILPTGNRLPVIPLDNDYRGAAFDHPLVVVGRTLVHVHRPKGRAGFVVAAMDTQEGRVVWETGLAIPPAGSPLVDSSTQTLTVANANGYVFRFDGAAIRSRVIDQPLAGQAPPPQARPLGAGVDLGEGRAAFSAADSDRVLLVDPAQASRPVQWVALPGALACPLSRFGDGLLAPLALGQVLYLNPADGKELGTSFQPRLEPGTTRRYTAPGVRDGAPRQFVISDGREKIYLVALTNPSKPQLQAVAEAAVGPDPIVSPIVVIGDAALAVTKHARLVRFSLPSLAPTGETQLSAPLVWGPFPAANGLILATAAGQLTRVQADGSTSWTQPLEHGDLVGPPLVRGDDLLLTYRKGILERRGLADGKPLGKADMTQSLAAGPVTFLSRIVLTANDGTLLIVDQP
jgi:outer membrane protein assembly factor BamB